MNEDTFVSDVLRRTLQDETPSRRARDLVPNIRRSRRNWRLLPVVAAALVLILMISSFTVPVVARALGEAPLLGDSFTKFLAGTGMDLAYQAGLVNDLNRSDSTDSITFTILSAYADATQGLIAFQFSSHDPTLIQELWDDPHLIFPWISKDRGSGGVAFSGTMQYLPEEGIIFGLLNSKPLAWSLFGHTLKAEVKSLGLSVAFPLQTVPSSLNEKVKVKQSFVFQGHRFMLDEVIFSPSATQVSYYFEGGAQIPQSNEGITWRFTLRTADGAEYTCLTGSIKGHGRGRGVMNFLPTHSSEVTIVFTGYNLGFEHQDRLPLKTGNTTVTPYGNLKIDEVASSADTTEITLAWSGLGRLGKPHIKLVDSAGNQGSVAEAEFTQDGITLLFEHGQLNGPVQVEIHYLELIVDEEIEVARIVRSK